MTTLKDSSEFIPFGERAKRLMQFYGVSTWSGLLEAMERHIEKLQAKVPRLTDEQHRTPREG